jgi:hypothetical protein
MEEDKKCEIHTHSHSPEEKCEQCGGEIEVTNASYPTAKVCKCKKCGHSFEWVEAQNE